MSEEPRPDWAPCDVDLTRPSAARVYDYLLGGGHNFAVDRDFGDRVQAVVPRIAAYARANRAALRRVVRHAVHAGYRQFVDIGSGIPTVGNVHEVADAARPEHDTRVLYIDHEAVACAHTEALIRTQADSERHHNLRADLLDYEHLWDRATTTGLIRTDQPIALLAMAVLHFIKDDRDPDTALAFYRDRLPPGSLLVLSTMTNEAPADEEEADALRRLVALYEETDNPGQLRDRTEFARFFGDLPLWSPGLVYAPAWRPDDGLVAGEFTRPEQSRILVGVAHKTA